MLVLSRRIGESFAIGEDMEVTIVDITGDKVVLGVNAPKTVRVTRVAAPEKAEGASPINERGYSRQYKKKLTEEQKPQ